MSKLLLVATVLSTIVLASCTQLNAEDEFQVTQILHNQGCYGQIDEFKVEHGEPGEYYVSNREDTFTITLRYNNASAIFSHDRLFDKCNISMHGF